MRHAKARQRLSEYLDRSLAAGDRAGVVRHLEGCEGCRDELAALEATVRLLRRMPDPEPPRALAAAVMERVRAGEAAGFGSGLRRWLTPLLAAPLLAGLAAFAVYTAPAPGPESRVATAAAPEQPARPLPAAAAAEPLLADAGLAARSQRHRAQLFQLSLAGRHREVARILRGAGHPHSASLASHLEAAEPEVAHASWTGR